MNKTLKALALGTIAGAVLITILAFAAPGVRADGLPLTITIGTVTVTPGETGVAVFGDIDNASGDVVYSDVASENVPYEAAIDDSDFYANTPYPFMAGEDSGIVELFSFDVSADATPGDYINDGSFAISEIDPNSPTGYDIVGLGTFTVDVVGGGTPTPEPSSLLLLIAGLGVIGLAWGKRRVAGRRLVVVDVATALFVAAASPCGDSKAICVPSD